MAIFGIDTSRWQGDFDFAAAKNNEKVEFAILKIGGSDNGRYKDVQFENSYKKCKAINLPVGAYFFGADMNIEAAKKSAAYLIELLAGKQFEYPIYYDVEAKMLNLPTDTLTNIIKTFCQTVESAGYFVGIYASESPLNSKINDSELKNYCHWVAKYGSKNPSLRSGSEVQMWQFGGETNVIRSNQINGQTVDQDYCYVDYPSIIKAAGKNGFGKSATQPAKPADPTPAPAPTPTPVPSTGKTYTVVAGDTLSGIGAKTGVAWKTIASLNGIGAPYTIYPGQVLKLDNGGSAPEPTPSKPAASTAKTYTVVAGDTLSGIGANTGVAWQTIASLNGIGAPYTIYPGQVLKLGAGSAPTPTPAAPAKKTYKVVAGDTLSGIGAKTGVKWQTIASLNGIGAPYTIYPGQVLKLN